jgi:protein-disulfide isomerase
MEPNETKSASSVLNIPTAIVIAGAIIAIAVIWSKTPSINKPTTNNERTFEQQVKPVTADDYIFGNPNAKVKIIEYSDTSCPFCKVFHNTMRKVMSEYGTSGNIAWAYRHYPLDKPDASGRILHPNAGREAEATECAGSLGGNEKFWKYINRLYEITPSVTSQSPNGLDQKELPKIAEYSGINVTDFNNCLSTGKFKEKVEASFLDGANIGINGTPASIVTVDKAFPSSIKEKLMQIYEPFKDPQTGEYPISISSDSKMIMMIGAMPYETVKATIDLLFTY